MSLCDDWRDVKYQQIFDEEIRGLTQRRQSGCKIEDLEGLLKTLYNLDGIDDGRGSLQDVIMEARIAAHEHFLAQWKAE
ncbi:MAG: hypothetical protein FWD26_07990 [Treponema sp.]|nr:hypothetical protein [Treponema sp.]